MKTLFIMSLLFGMPIACAQDDLEDDANKGNQLTHKYLVAQGAKNKALLMRVFNAVKKIEEDKKSTGARALEVRQRISSTEFLVNAGGATDYWFITLAPKDWDNRDRFRTDAEFTDQTKTFRNESGETITVRVLKEKKSKPVPPFTQEEFVQRLKDGETWTLTDFERRKCKFCGGDGMIEKREEYVECAECHDGEVSVDYLVSWW